MPGVTLHFVLATQALDRWRASGASIPFDPDDPIARNAFYHGAMGPDFGYLPGGHRLLSDLAHCLRSGELTTRLIQGARTPRERAFAWGWATHVIGDRLVHPWIGRGVGELVEGRPDRFVAGWVDPENHLRVELGVDCWFAARHAHLRSIRLRPVFDAVSIAFLEGAYRTTYGFSPPVASLLRSHLAAGKRVGQALFSLPVLRALAEVGTGSRAWPGVRRALAAAYRVRALRGVVLAYLNPVAPARWLLARIEGAVDEHARLFMRAVHESGAGIGDYDLDTGEPGGRPVAIGDHVAPAGWRGDRHVPLPALAS